MGGGAEEREGREREGRKRERGAEEVGEGATSDRRDAMCVRVCAVEGAQTLNASSTRSLLLSAACVQVIAMILASFTNR